MNSKCDSYCKKSCFEKDLYTNLALLHNILTIFKRPPNSDAKKYFNKIRCKHIKESTYPPGYLAGAEALITGKGKGRRSKRKEKTEPVDTLTELLENCELGYPPAEGYTGSGSDLPPSTYQNYSEGIDYILAMQHPVSTYPIPDRRLGIPETLRPSGLRKGSYIGKLYDAIQRIYYPESVQQYYSPGTQYYAPGYYYMPGMLEQQYAKPGMQYVVPRIPSQDYGAPGIQNGAPGIPLGQYGAPGVPWQQYRAPEMPGQQYGAPGPQYGTPGSQYGTPGSQYGAPGPLYGTPGSQYGGPGPLYGTPGSQYGAPGPQYGSPVTQYGPPGKPGKQYGAPNILFGSPGPQYGSPRPQYGVPRTPGQQYGAQGRPGQQYGAQGRPGQQYDAQDRPGQQYDAQDRPGQQFEPFDPLQLQRELKSLDIRNPDPYGLQEQRRNKKKEFDPFAHEPKKDKKPFGAYGSKKSELENPSITKYKKPKEEDKDSSKESGFYEPRRRLRIAPFQRNLDERGPGIKGTKKSSSFSIFRRCCGK